MKISLKHQLTLLDLAAESLMNAEVAHRNAEINNIRTAIQGALEDILEPEGRVFARQVIEQMSIRINDLAADPQSAGRHDLIVPPAPDTLEDEPCPDTERSIESGVFER